MNTRPTRVRRGLTFPRARLPRRTVAAQQLPPESEDKFQTKVLELARIYHWKTYHTYDSQRSTAGFPDLVLVRPPRLIFAELKSAGGNLTVAQKEWLEDI